MKDNKIKVICLENNKIFNSIKEAGNYYNIDPSGISKILKGKQKTAGGYTWEKYVDINEILNNEISNEEILNSKKIKLETNYKLTKNEKRYWLNKFIKESKFNSIEELDESIHQLYLSIKNEIY